jgi:hypothetical protein
MNFRHHESIFHIPHVNLSSKRYNQDNQMVQRGPDMFGPTQTPLLRNNVAFSSPLFGLFKLEKTDSLVQLINVPSATVYHHG